MELHEVKALVDLAVANLRATQPNLHDFTPATLQTEWNIAHHLACEIKELFPDHDCDLDVSKPNLNNMRPDIIIHERGNHDNNLLVIEVKRDAVDIWEDVTKITGFWFDAPLNYQFGAVVAINEYADPVVEVFETLRSADQASKAR